MDWVLVSKLAVLLFTRWLAGLELDEWAAAPISFGWAV